MHAILLTTLLATPSPLTPQATAGAPAATATVSPDMEARLEQLVEKLEQARVSRHIVGMSLAIVQGDEVLLTHGFGTSDLEPERPVTAETLFGIGSTTKAFTSTLAGMLVDEGAMDWDHPITRYLPYFDLDTGEAEAEVTLRDLLSHRSGFTRMSALMLEPGVPRETILRTAAGAEPFAPFRKEFHYNNIMFLAAGVAAGVAADSDWDTLIRERIFEPLGMDASSTTYAEAQDGPDLAAGFLWDEEKQDHEPKAMANIDGIGPAGSINSNAVDMARWLRLLIGKGEVDGVRLVSEQSLETTWTPQQAIGGGVNYGFGWMLRSYQGQPLIEHGGNIGGFAAQVAFLPDAELGFALLTNAAVTPLQGESIPIVFDTLLGDDQPTDGEAPGEGMDYGPFVGRYVANFAAFHDDIFEVRVSDGHLAIDVPRQQLYGLKDPNEDGRWVFALTNQIAVSFQRDDAGSVVGLTMHQNGFDFEAPREGVEVQPEIPLEDLQRFLGRFQSDDGKVEGEVVIQNNRLAVDIPDQMVFELHPPAEDERWTFRVNTGIAVSFQDGEEGQVESLTLHEPGGEKLLRLLPPAEGTPELPGIEEILALRRPAERSAALAKAGTLRMTGSTRFANAGLEGAYTMWITADGRHREHLDFGPFGTITNALNGDEGWSRNPMSGVEATDGEALRAMRLTHMGVMAGDWREHFKAVTVLGVEDEDGAVLARVRLTPEDAPALTVFVDLETGDVVRSEGVHISDVVTVPVVNTFADFREVDGIRIPFESVSVNDWSGRIVTRVEHAETGVDLEPGLFEMPATTED